jgi:hypothetical protein
MAATVSPEAGATRHHRRLPTEGVAVYPSAALRPIPSFTIAVPDGWEIDEAPDTIGVLRIPQAIDGFWVNLVIASDRIDHRIKLAHAASVTLEKLRAQCADLQVIHDHVADFGGRLMSIRVIELTAPTTGRALAQVQGMTIAERAEGAKTRDLFHLTGTCAREDVDRFGPVFVATISSFRLV